MSLSVKLGETAALSYSNVIEIRPLRPTSAKRLERIFSLCIDCGRLNFIDFNGATLDTCEIFQPCRCEESR